MNVGKSLSVLRRKARFAVRLSRAFIQFRDDFKRFKTLAGSDPRFALHRRDNWMILRDKTINTDFDHHYIYHPAWAARLLAQIRPDCHVDISSSLHFCTLVSAFIKVKFYDYRPAQLALSNLTSEKADLMALPFGDKTLTSLSCMHVVEHIGLGRYGDAIDPQGDLKAIAELKRVLAVGGSLFFVVPIGQPRLQFNAHRIYSYEQVKSYFAELTLRDFSLITDSGEMMNHASPALANSQRYGCGCFWFVRDSN